MNRVVPAAPWNRCRVRHTVAGRCCRRHERRSDQTDARCNGKKSQQIRHADRTTAQESGHHSHASRIPDETARVTAGNRGNTRRAVSTRARNPGTTSEARRTHEEHLNTPDDRGVPRRGNAVQRQRIQTTAKDGAIHSQDVRKPVVLLRRTPIVECSTCQPTASSLAGIANGRSSPAVIRWWCRGSSTSTYLLTAPNQPLHLSAP